MQANIQRVDVCDPLHGLPHISMCLPADCVTGALSKHCSLSPTLHGSPRGVTISVFISRTPSQVAVWAWMSQLLRKKLKFTPRDPGGLCNRALHLANWLTESKVKLPILQSLFCPHYSAESQYVVMNSTWCQQCGALGGSHDPGCLFKWWWMHWWVEHGALTNTHSRIEGADVSWGLLFWQYMYYVFWSQLGNDPWMDWASLRGVLHTLPREIATSVSSFL